jgi:MFS family permease
MLERTIPAVRPRLFTRSFSLLLVAQACFGYAFSSFFLLPKYLVQALSAGPEQIGYVLATHPVAAVVLLPLMGAAVDRFGRRGFLTAGALVMAAASLGFVFVDSVGPLIYVLRAVQALAFAMAFAAGAALAVDEAPPERVGQAIGVWGLAFLAMNFVAPSAVEEVAARVDWSAAFATAGGGALLCAVLSRRIRESHPKPDGGEQVPGLLEVAKRPSQLRILLIIGLAGAGWLAIVSFHQPYALELGMERLRSFFISYAAVAITVRVGFGHLVDRWGHRRVSLISLALYAGVLLAVVELRTLGLVAIGAGMGVAHGAFYPAFNALAVEEAGARERGKVMALFQAAFNAGASGGAVGFGLLAARAGYPAVFQMAAGCLLAALLLLLASPEGRRSSAQSQGGAS